MTYLTLQQVLQQHFPEYERTHKLPLYQLKGVSALMKCRTAIMGGHALYCEKGHLNGYWYNSCGHRSCPQCGALKKEKWLRKVDSFLLDSPHHHWVFTLPHALHDIWFYNRELCQKLLFDSVRKTLQVLSADKQYLRAKFGGILSLHTWARNLTFHPHIHCLIAHGGLLDNNWVEPKRKVMFPAKVMMQLFRGKYLAGLKRLFSKGEVKLPIDMTKTQFLSLMNKWGRLNWVVHCAKRYEHGKGVIKYLARYIRGGAIKNSQLLKCSSERVQYRYWSHERQKVERISLSPSDFIERVLSHIALARKQQYHFIGLYHNRSRRLLTQARACLSQAPIEAVADIQWEEYLGELGNQLCCEQCGGQVMTLRKLSQLECNFLKETLAVQ
jgi:hypothetical protein